MRCSEQGQVCVSNLWSALPSTQIGEGLHSEPYPRLAIVFGVRVGTATGARAMAGSPRSICTGFIVSFMLENKWTKKGSPRISEMAWTQFSLLHSWLQQHQAQGIMRCLVKERHIILLHSTLLVYPYSSLCQHTSSCGYPVLAEARNCDAKSFLLGNMVRSGEAC
jgi:hypothetical protein